MELEYAQKLASQFIGMDTTETLCVFSNGEVYINNDINSMKQVASEKGVKIFVFKDKEPQIKEEQPKVEEPKIEEPIAEEAPKRKSKKK